MVRVRAWWNGHPGDELDAKVREWLKKNVPAKDEDGNDVPPVYDAGCGGGVRDIAITLPFEAADNFFGWLCNTPGLQCAKQLAS